MGEAQDIQVKPQERFPAPRWIRNTKGFFWRHKFSVVFVAACVAAGTIAGAIHVREQIRQERRIEARRQRWLLLKADLEKVIKDFNGDAGIVVKDLSTRWEFTFNKYERFPAASLLKLPIMLALYEAAHQGKINLADTFHLTENCKVGGSGVLKTIPAGAQFTIDELIALMIGSSDNTATNILLGMLDFTYFNRWFETFGLQQTSLARKMMDFRYRKQGVENYTCASDVGFALEKLYRKEFINSGYSDKCIELLKSQHVRDRIPRKLPAGAVVAHKTGLERRVCHDAGIVYTQNGDFLICVLTKDVPNFRRAKDFIATVASRVYAYYENP